MEYGLLIGVVAFILAVGFYGYKRGIINIVLSMVAMIVTAILATMLTAPVGAVVKAATPIYDNIYDTVYENIKEKNVVNSETLDNLNLPEELTEIINDKIEADLEEVKDKVGANIDGAAEEFMKTAAEEVANAIFKAGIFLVLFIVIYIVVKILIHVFDIVAKLPIIKEANKLGGFVAGLVVGLILVWVACLVLMACSNKEWAIDVYKQIDDNQLLGLIYNNNPLTKFFTKIM